MSAVDDPADTAGEPADTAGVDQVTLAADAVDLQISSSVDCVGSVASAAGVPVKLRQCTKLILMFPV